MPIDCEPGDIVLVPDEGYFSLVSVGQGVIRLNPVIAVGTSGGSIYINHAAIAVGTAMNFQGNHLVVNQVAHATGNKGICRAQLSAYGSNMRVYRLALKYRAYALEAHSVALTWTQVPGMGYALDKAFVSPAFGLSMYGPAARERARFYYSHRHTVGGPPGVKHAKKTMFCSMFVIACYQAALGEALSQGFMALDAKNTSPMKLQDYLSNHGAWESVG